MHKARDYYLVTLDVVSNIGDEVRGERLRRGLTLADLARECGVSESELSRLENGATPSMPRLRVLLAWLAHSVER